MYTKEGKVNGGFILVNFFFTKNPNSQISLNRSSSISSTARDNASISLIKLKELEHYSLFASNLASFFFRKSLVLEGFIDINRSKLEDK